MDEESTAGCKPAPRGVEIVCPVCGLAPKPSRARQQAVPFVRYGVIGVYRNTPDLKPLEKAGAAGVVYMWNNVSDGNAEDQALPFSAASSSVPALWVNATTGRKLKQAAASGASMTLTLDAAIHPDTPTDNLWAILPGKTDETIIINTHTDGCNACEENGGLGVVALGEIFCENSAGAAQPHAGFSDDHRTFRPRLRSRREGLARIESGIDEEGRRLRHHRTPRRERMGR